MGWAKIPGTNMEQFTDANGNVTATQPLDGKATAAPPTSQPSAAPAPAPTPAMPVAPPAVGAPPDIGSVGAIGKVMSAAPEMNEAPSSIAALGAVADGAAQPSAMAAGSESGVAGMLRALGRRSPPMESTSLAERGRKVY